VPELGYELMRVKPKDIRAAGKQHNVSARSLFCFWAVRELGETIASLTRKFRLIHPVHPQIGCPESADCRIQRIQTDQKLAYLNA